MKTNYVLIDYENVQVKSLTLLNGDHFRVRVFLGPHNTKLSVEFVLAMQELGDRGQYVVLETPGANALDFHIAYYLGVLTTGDPAGFFHIISRDTGFDPLIQHLRTRKIFSVRSASIEEMPCFREPPAGASVISDAGGNGKPKSNPARASLDELIKVAVDDLAKRKASKPGTPKTLRSTLCAQFGKKIPAADVDAVYAGLVKRGYVKVDGKKVRYALPVT